MSPFDWRSVLLARHAQHVVCAWASVVVIWTVWFLDRRARRTAGPTTLSILRIVLEFIGIGLLTLTGHLGGFLSGVNGGV